ncbi:T9SS type A sorting domain-containing protein [Gaoshiqia sp. Z1-71]|uniref:T9SS type A sorting domain-containing protein n=1 Tax=Gaoshiqia hydrogeniformans TaxID=3290090 RepID=UPI003BF7FF14
MKKIILTLIALIYLNVNGQNTDFKDQMSQIFANVDLSQVPSGLLYDYGLGLVADTLFDGTLVDDNMQALHLWKSLYTDIWSSQVNSSGNLTSLESVNQLIESNSSSSAVLIPVLFYKYHRISPDAITNNLMYINNDQIFDTPGRVQSPYINQIAFAAAPVESEIDAMSGQVKMKLQQATFFTNSTSNVTSIYVDGGDGSGYKQVNWGNEFSFSYGTDGYKEVKVKFSFSDGTILYSHFTINVTITTATSKSSTTQVIPIDPSLVRSYNGQKATGTVTIIYSGTATILDKPLIVFEGYDTWKIIEPDNPKKNVTWEHLLVNFSEMGYLPENFQAYLTSNGYDIVYVDYDNGTDYIQRNAYFAEAVIKTVNQLKTGSEPNVVMGISMGGLVGRYALADMENRSESHNTRLFISADSPHQGANVPLGLQAMVRHMTDLKLEIGFAGNFNKIWDIGTSFPEYARLLALLQQPASRQMLKQQLSGFGENIYIDNSIHDSFMTEYNQLGMPKLCRNIALSNGSGAASNSWQFAPGGAIFDLQVNCNLGGWSTLLGPVLLVLTPYVKQLWDMPLLALTSFIPGNYGLKANCNIKALPNIGSLKVYDGEIKIKKKILWLINVYSTLTSTEVNYAGNGFPWDSGMGGYMSFDDFAGDFTETFNPNELPSCMSLTLPSGNFCFVPEVSSLDIQGTQNLLKGYTPVTDLKNSMFDNFYTEPSVNTPHTNFNSYSTQWLQLELGQDQTTITQSNVYKFNECAINGPNVVCNSGTTFSITNFPSGVDLSWNTSSNMTKTSSGEDYVVLIATGSGNGWVQAELSGGGTNVFSELKTVYASELPSPTIYGNSTVKCGYSLNFHVDQLSAESGESFCWDSDVLSISNSDRPECTVSGTDPAIGYISCTVTACGVPKTSSNVVRVIGCPFLLLSPNPSTGETTVSIETASAESPDMNTEWDLEVYDQSQMLKLKKTKLKNHAYNLNTSGWKEGVYIVCVSYNSETLTGKLIVKK